ncbi:MAG: hypothetical protein RBS80_26145, partial [Thermoguttaceae bacterium]|nr:hypothetical protein [Thermoguttaceae bacterium]
MFEALLGTAPRRWTNGRTNLKQSLGYNRRLRCEPLEDRRMLSISFGHSDLQFILDQILISEAHSAGADLTSLIPNTELSFGLRTVDGTYNNLIPGRTDFGAADNVFPRLLEPVFRDAEDGTSYAQTTGLVFDSQV